MMQRSPQCIDAQHAQRKVTFWVFALGALVGGSLIYNLFFLDQALSTNPSIGYVLFGFYLFLLITIVLFLSRSRHQATKTFQAIQDNEIRLKCIIAELADGLIVTDTNNQITMMNHQAEHMLGWSEDQAIGHPLTDIVYGKKHANGDSPILNYLDFSGTDPHKDDIFQIRNHGELAVSYTATPLLIDDQPQGAVITFQDITKRKQAQAELHRLATHDGLTGLYNRRELDQRLNETFDLSKRYNRPMAMLMLDIDFFKKINDRYGHQAGDIVLKTTGNILREEIRDADSAGRYGGEEFVILLPETNSSDAVIQAERIHKRIESTLMTAGEYTDIAITISIGISSFPIHAQDLKTLINAADTALYAAKNNGRNQIQVAPSHTDSQ